MTMFSKTNLRRGVAILAVISVPFLTACEQPEQPEDTVRVTTDRLSLIDTARQAKPAQCPQGAEFGRCGCYLNGLQTTCDVVNMCLENGFCVVARQ